MLFLREIDIIHYIIFFNSFKQAHHLNYSPASIFFNIVNSGDSTHALVLHSILFFCFDPESIIINI